MDFDIDTYCSYGQEYFDRQKRIYDELYAALEKFFSQRFACTKRFKRPYFITYVPNVAAVLSFPNCTPAVFKSKQHAKKIFTAFMYANISWEARFAFSIVAQHCIIYSPEDSNALV